MLKNYLMVFFISMVPMLTCGLERANFAFSAIGISSLKRIEFINKHLLQKQRNVVILPERTKKRRFF